MVTSVFSCPFCGNNDIDTDVKIGKLHSIKAWAECKACHATGPKIHIPVEEVITDTKLKYRCYEAWNKRK